MKKLITTVMLSIASVAVCRNLALHDRLSPDEEAVKWRESVLSTTNMPLTASTRAVEWRRGVDTNCVTVSVVTGQLDYGGTAVFLERDFTYDADGRLKSISPVRRAMSGKNDYMRQQKGGQ